MIALFIPVRSSYFSAPSNSDATSIIGEYTDVARKNQDGAARLRKRRFQTESPRRVGRRVASR